MSNSFINFLKKNENTRRIFGERELKIIEKQLLGIKLTQSEKNRLSRDIRKKFKFIKEAKNFYEEFELKKASIIKDLINEAKDEILRDQLANKIKKIIISGSFVENKLHIKSDVDISVEFFDITLKEATLFRIRMASKINEKVDIQVYNVLPEKIKKEIDNKGKILYERKNNW